MKTKSLLLAALCFVSCLIHAAPFGTAFTYQGYLSGAGSPANGNYDLQFALFDSANNGNPVGPTLTNLNVSVHNGLFLVTLDFGDVFEGSGRWLALGVRTNGNPGALFTAQTPLQPLTPAPNALYAANAGAASNVMSGSISAAQLSTPEGSPSAGQVLTYNGTNLVWTSAGGNGSSNAWGLSGNAGTSQPANFLGTTDNNPIVLRVNGQIGWRLTPTSDTPNVVGGDPANFVAGGIYGATIAGGGSIGLQLSNAIGSSFATIGGGEGNSIEGNANNSAIGGGITNSIAAPNCAISGGNGNEIILGAGSSFIGGGQINEIDANSFDSIIGGGYFNYIAAITGTIAGGSDNVISTGSYNSSIGGGFFNVVNAPNSGIGGGNGNEIALGAGSSFIGGGQTNEIDLDSFDSVIVGGFQNYIGSITCTLAGGSENFIGTNSFDSVISGGASNSVFGFGSPSASATYATIGGGFNNGAGDDYATVPGGSNNIASGIASFAAGANAFAGDDYSFVWGDGSRQALAQGPNTFTVLAINGIYCYTGAGGAYLGPGDTSWNVISDRNAKKNFQPVDTVAVLDKLAAIPIQQWNYKWQKDTEVPNIGPMAQDFKAAFYPGRDEKGITTLEFDGVELAAIQGLNQKVAEQNKKLEAALKEKDARIAELEKEMGDLKQAEHQTAAQWEARFEALRRDVAGLANKSAVGFASLSPTAEPK